MYVSDSFQGPVVISSSKSFMNAVGILISIAQHYFHVSKYDASRDSGGNWKMEYDEKVLQ